MRYRQQATEAERSDVFGTTAGLPERCDIPEMLVSKWFREVDNAARFMQRKDESTTGRIVRYSAHPHDVRVVVTYYGNVPKSRVKLAKQREIMRDGMTVDRRLPVRVVEPDAFSFDAI